MMTTLRRIGLLWLAGWTMLSPSLLHGRDLDAAADLYGRGVHAYFAGRVGDAESLLSRALVLNDQDPRLYYFRALSRLRLGRGDEARRDMAAGAAREAGRANRYAVGAALQRVQGSHRLLLEQYRRDARSKAATVGAEVARQRTEQMTARDAGAFREKVVIPLDELFRPGGPHALSAEELAGRAADAQQSRVVPVQPAESGVPAAAVAAEDNPFEDDAPQSDVEPSPPSASESSPAPAAATDDDEADENPFDF
jgi:hypothetical protein